MRPITKSQVPIGLVLSGRYRVSRELGRGGMAAVYEAEHIEIGKRVAVKILDPALARNDNVIERFHREARAAASVNSPNICDVFDVGRLDDGRPYLVMELLEGETLYERMVSEGQLRLQDAVRILSQVGRGLARAHAVGIIHRDLKPENIFLHRDSEGDEIVKLVDFGLAKFHSTVPGDERLTREGAIFGTPLYMSPEQISGQGQADHRSDLWALGCIAFECVTGRPIWPVERGMAFIFAQIITQPIPIPSSFRPNLPRAFDVWFNRALQRAPDDRYQSAQQMVVDLASALGQDPTGLVSAPVILPNFNGSGPVIVKDSRYLEPASSEIEALAPTEPPPNAPIDSAPEFPPSQKDQTKPANRIPWAVVATGGAILGLVAFGSLAWWTKNSLESSEQNNQPALSASISASIATPSIESSIPSVEPASPTAPQVPLPAWADTIRQGQLLISKGRIPAAVSLFERATERSGHPALLTMLDHTRIASATAGPCSIVALGRPRPFDVDQPARSAFAIPTASSSLLSWTSGDALQAFVIPLNPALQSAGPGTNLTPKGRRVVGTRLVQDDRGPALLYVDLDGDGKGIWLQRFQQEGGLSGDPLRVSYNTGTRTLPSAAAHSTGLWIAYTDRVEGQVFDVYLRRLKGELSEPIRVTAHGMDDAGDGRDAGSPQIVFSKNRVVVGYVRQTLRENEVVIHRPGTIEDLMDGRATLTPTEEGLGSATVVSETRLMVHSLSMACDVRTCFVGWRNQPTGTHVVALDISSGKVLWRRTFASKGTDVAVAIRAEERGVIVWFERGRVRAAPLSREGMGGVTVLARVHGEQTAPSLFLEGSGETWLTSWTCFEGGRPEVYAARFRCKEE